MGREIGMGVTYNPIAFLKLSGWDNIFTNAFFIAAADGDYFSGIFHTVLLLLLSLAHAQLSRHQQQHRHRKKRRPVRG